MLGIKQGADLGIIYLGAKIDFRAAKAEAFKGMGERIMQRLLGWEERMLSTTGKETLLKSVALSIPNYLISCFKVPPKCSKISRLK